VDKNEAIKLTYEQKIDLIRNGNLWCPMTFWVGIIAKLNVVK